MGKPRFRRRDGLVRREVGGDLLLFDPTDDSLHTLNATGAVVWDHLDRARTPDELEDVLRAEFDVAGTDQVGRDVARILADLEGRGLVRAEV